MKSGNLSMLIVDDEGEALKLFREIFESRGWRVFTVPTGEAALGVMEREKIDIVLLDIRLPAKSGIEVLKDIKNRYAAVPVVMITALGWLVRDKASRDRVNAMEISTREKIAAIEKGQDASEQRMRVMLVGFQAEQQRNTQRIERKIDSLEAYLRDRNR